MAIREAGRGDRRGSCNGLDPFAALGSAGRPAGATVRDIFRDLVRGLARDRARVRAPDRPGGGRAPATPGAKGLALLFMTLACVAANGTLAGGARADRAVNAPDFEVRIEGPDHAPVEDAVVALVPAAGGRAGAAGAQRPRATMDQQDLAFVPHVLAVEAGTVVDFPNSDQVRHSIYSFSAAKRFEVRLYRGFEAPPITFDQTGLVVLGCNIHDHMLGFVYVLDTPHFGVSDAQGAARIAGVPAGRYRLEVRHPRLDEGLVASREIELPAAAPLVIPFGTRPPARPPARPEIDPLQSLFGAASR